MVPLNEVKGQMEDKSVSHLNMPLSLPTRQNQTDSERENLMLGNWNVCTVMDALFFAIHWKLQCEK